MKKSSTIWHIVGSLESSFAGCLHRSPVETVHRPCTGCYEGAVLHIPYPITIEWNVGSNHVGDFSWPGSGRSIVKETVFEKIVNAFPIVRSEPIEMFQDPALKIPKNKKRAKPRVWLPYEGPRLLEMVPIHSVPAHTRTTWAIMSRCRVCGRDGIRLDGYELREHRWSQEKKDLIPFHRKREPGHGLFVSGQLIKGRSIFRVDELYAWIFCTNEFKHFIEDQGFTNIDFLEYGEVVDEG